MWCMWEYMSFSSLALVVRCHHHGRHHRWFVEWRILVSYTIFFVGVENAPVEKKRRRLLCCLDAYKRKDAQEKMIHMFLHSHKQNGHEIDQKRVRKSGMATMTITLYFPVIFLCYLSCVAIDHIHFELMHEIHTHVRRQQSRSFHPSRDYHRPRKKEKQT